MVFRIVTARDPEAATEFQTADRQTAGLAAIALLLLLVVSGVFVTRELMAAHMLQTCIASGNRHCQEILPALHRLLPAGWNCADTR